MKNRGYYGEFGGAFLPEILISTFDELESHFLKIKEDPAFWQEYADLMSIYSCRPTPLTYAENLTAHFGGAKIYLKREDLNHTGAHKINNVMGQGLLVRRMGKSRVIAETGAGQHGVATATMAAKFGFDCTIYMGEVDVIRQRPNVFWMKRLGAKVYTVTDGTKILKDAINEAFRDWVTNMDDTHYVLGTACGPHPFPEMVAYFQSIIGKEARRQIQAREGKLPSKVYACVGGGSNALGLFSGFLDDTVELVGVEAGGKGLNTGKHASRLCTEDSKIGVAQGYKTYFLQNDDGQMQETHSISAGLDYVGVSPILSDLHKRGRVRFTAATDKEVVEAMELTMQKRELFPHLNRRMLLYRLLKRHPRYPKRMSSLSINPVEEIRIFLRLPMRLTTRNGLSSLLIKESNTMLERYLKNRLHEKKILLMTHIVIGYPSFDHSKMIISEMVRAGVDLMELQIPFSEPIADGPVILRANQRALERGVTVKQCMDFVNEICTLYPIPFLYMTYYNILLQYGIRDFVAHMKRQGIVGSIVPDLPPEEGAEYLAAMRQSSMVPILIYSPNTSQNRMKYLASLGDGFIYCIARKGVTGKETLFSDALNRYLSRCREASKLPLAVGFGVKEQKDVDFLTGKSDIAVVGSQTIRIIDNDGVEAMGNFIRSLRE